MQKHKMLKARILSLALSAAMVCTMLPATVFAAEGAVTKRTTPLDVHTGVILDAEGGTLQPEGGVYDMLAAEGWKWDTNNKNLTLRGYNADVADRCGILFPADTTIVLIGENSVKSGDSIGLQMDGTGDLTITGTGSLAIDSKASSILSYKDIVIDSGTITAISADASTIWANGGAINISGSADVTATSSKLCGLQAVTSITIDGGKVNAVSTGDCGIFVPGSLTIGEDADVTAEGKWGGIQAGNNNSAGNITINGKLTTTSTDDSGIFTSGNLTIGPTADVRSEGKTWHGAQANGNVTINGKIVANGVKTGIYTPGTLSIGTSADVTAVGEQSGGLNSTGNMTINGGKLNVPSSSEAAVYAGGTLTVSGAPEVTITGKTSGLQSTGDMNLGGGTINVTSAENIAIFSSGKITVGKDAAVTADGKWAAIYTTDNMEINGTIIATGDESSSIAVDKALTIGADANVTTSSVGFSGIFASKGITSAGVVDATGRTGIPVGGPINALGAGISSYGLISVTGGRIHAKGGNDSAIVAKSIQQADEAPYVQINLGSAISEKNGAHIVFGDTWIEGDAESRCWSTFLAKDVDALIPDAEGYPANAVREVWLGVYHDVTLSGTEANASGSGRYAAGETVSINAGTKNGYTFSGWTSSPAGVTFANAGSASTNLAMPNNSVELIANWKLASSSGGGGGGGSATSNPGSSVTVDGKTENIGKTEDKNNTTTVVVDQGKLTDKVSDAKNGSSVVVPVTATGNNAAAAQLAVSNVEAMAGKNMTLTIQTKDTSYELPTSAIDTAGIVAQLGATDAAKVPFTVTITQEKNVKVEGAAVVGTPMNFTISASYNGKSVNVDRFDAMVTRTMEITKDQAAKVTTAVVVDANGSNRHVPTDVYQSGGRWYAKVNSMTNSTYALIENKSVFAGLEGKWYADAANELSARKVTDGVFPADFEGSKDITRAEFAALLVNGLGLPKTVNADFNDVSADAWYSKAVATASEYGIINGYTDGTFKPNATITRQEAMVMVAHAAKIMGYAGKTGELTAFSDLANVGTWAMESVKFNVGSGLIVGNSGKLMPRDNITRGETATVVLRLLQQSGLVDVRAKV